MYRTKMKQEAIRRMLKLNLMDDVMKYFIDEDKLYYSERVNSQFPDLLYYLDNKPDYVEKVKEFEERTGYLVYHVIETITTFGKILDFLFVSKYEDDWEYELEDYDGKFIAMSMANNLSDENCSDMGSIYIRPAIGGIERIG